MTPTALALLAAERLPLPDILLRRGVERLCEVTSARLDTVQRDVEATFARDMLDYPIAIETDAANAQHYELPRLSSGWFWGRAANILAASTPPPGTRWSWPRTARSPPPASMPPSPTGRISWNSGVAGAR